MFNWTRYEGLRRACFAACVLVVAACGSNTAETEVPASTPTTPAPSAGTGGSAASSAPSGGTPAASGSSGGVAGTAGAPTSTSTVGAAGQGGAAGATPVAAAGAGGAEAAGAGDEDAAAGSGGAIAAAGSGGEVGAGGASGAAGAAGEEAAAGSGGGVAAAGSGGDAAAAGAGAQPPPREDLGEGDGRDVITIGDSWMSNTLGTGNGIEGALDRLTSRPYRHFGVQGVMLLSSSLFGPAIPTQYTAAKRGEADIKTVIMTGGGNDIIQNPTIQASCSEGGEECKELLGRITDGLNTLWTEMAEDGVQDVVYINYSRDAGSTDDSVRGSMRTAEICSTGRIRCHSLDTTEAVMAELADGIHPTRAANDRIAKVLYALLEKEGVRR
ncbi:MAG: hypothetical protein ABW321_12760 [Polyangiales bacterium]